MPKRHQAKKGNIKTNNSADLMNSRDPAQLIMSKDPVQAKKMMENKQNAPLTDLDKKRIKNDELDFH
ncbi:MAG: hypothetical protein LBN09_03615 [Clostridioides sp.]|jgi:hypothetical protein|nr:hypothetical protein [Clostridioides sp.]